jgi:FKBP-type peptidyl-prolyl cis-trans isomerase
MNSMKQFVCLGLGILLLTSCNKATYKKTPGGMPYQVFASKDTQKIYQGNIIKISYSQKINDSVYFSNEGKVPFYIPVSAEANPYDISEIWTKIKLGDSVIATQMMDTFIKRNPQGILPQFKKGDRVLTFVKVLGVFTTNEAATEDEKKEKMKLQETETAFLQNYLKEKNIVVQKTPSGAFIEIINPGTGAAIDSGNYVSLNYTGTSFSGVRFDSNTDTSFHHTEPLSFTIGSGQMMLGFDEAVKQLKPGGVARVYIPSTLAYGPNPGTPKIKPYEHLIFDIEVLDVKDKMPTRSDKALNRNKEVDVPQPKN